jgi:hypothetical protein
MGIGQLTARRMSPDSKRENGPVKPAQPEHLIEQHSSRQSQSTTAQQRHDCAGVKEVVSAREPSGAGARYQANWTSSPQP